MALVLVIKEGRSCPMIICDHCGKTITNARAANYQWRAGAEPAHLIYVHKVCARAFEDAHQCGPRMLWAWDDLALLPGYLAGNLGLVAL